MRRRHFLGVLAVGFGLGTAGCSSETESPPAETPSGEPTDANNRTVPPEYDCDEASRPTLREAVRARNETLEPLPYPDGPPPLGNEGAVTDYVTQYERAYVRKRERRDAAGSVTNFDLYPPDAKTYRVLGGSAVVRLKYWFTYQIGDGTVLDSSTQYATYYIDESVVIRTERDGPLEDEGALVPDPWESGVPVECFE